MQNNSNIFDKIKVGDLIFVRSKDIIGACIRFLTTSEINHVAIYIGNEQILESQLDSGVEITDLNAYLNDNTKEVYVGNLKNIDEKICLQAIDFGKTLLHSPYDLIGQIGILFKIIVMKIGLSKLVYFYGKNITQSQRGYWCSELVAYCYDKVNTPLTDVDQRYATPEDLARSNKIDFKNLN